jgi:hypothetical protein
MNQHRTAVRWFAGLLLAGAITGVGMAPAQADTSWNGTTVSGHRLTTTSLMQPADTAWNGT